MKNPDSGIFYLRARVKGHLVFRTLDTKVFTKAKTILPDKLKGIREEMQQGERPEGALERDATFEDAAKRYTALVNSDRNLQPSSREVRTRPLQTLRRTWPDIFEMQLRKIDPVSIENYIISFESGKWPYLPNGAKTKTVAGNSASTFNKMVTTLRGVFDLAIKDQVITKSPVAELSYKPARKKLLTLPSKQQFARIVRHIRTKAGKGRIAGDLVEGLAYSGLRIEESNTLLWEDLDHDRGMITVKGTKTEGSARVIPMIPAFKELTLRMREHRETILGRAVLPMKRVFEAGEALLSLRKACEAVGGKKMTHHDLRHLFATTCIESGVDIPTVAAWLGHADGGVLAMQTYGHIRPSHSSEAAKKVSF